MRNRTLVFSPVIILILTVPIIYLFWYIPYLTHQDNPMQLGVVFQPGWYDQTSALQQLQKIASDGFKLWATDVSPYPLSQTEFQTRSLTFQESRRLGLKVMLRCQNFYSDNSSICDTFLSYFALNCNYFLVLSEIQRFLDAGYSVDRIKNEFILWATTIKQYNPSAIIFTSFTASWVLVNPLQTSQIVSAINSQVDAYGFSAYEYNAPTEVSMPMAVQVFRGFIHDKPLWITETGTDVDPNWLINELEIFRSNGFPVSIIWIWHTYWGDLGYTVRDTQTETMLSDFMKKT